MATDKKRRGGMTLAEHDAMLKATGKYDEMVERHQRLERERDARVAEWRRAEEPLRAELAEVGVEVESVWDLVNTSKSYPEALPILLDHLQRDYPPRVLEGIARALAVPPARFAWPVIVELYKKATADNTKDGLAVALVGQVDDALWPELLELIRDRRNGPSRILLLTAVQYWDDDRAEPVLTEFEDDPDLRIEVEELRRRRARRKKQRENRREQRRKQSRH